MTRPPETFDQDTATALLSGILADAENAIGVSDVRGFVRMANKALLSLLRYDEPSQMVGQPVMNMIAPAAREMVATMMRRRALGEPLPGSYRVRGMRRDGSEFAMEVLTCPFLTAGEPLILSFMREIPEQPTEWQLMAKDDQFYRALFNVNTAVKILIEPTTGRIVDANQAAVEMYGWPRETLLQMRISDINLLTGEEVQAEMERARTGLRRYFRFRHRIADGRVRHVEVHSGPVEMEGSQYLLSIIHDVTERNALEERLHEAQRLESVGRLAAGVAHDFNNLLTVILSATELLAAQLSANADLAPYVHDVSHAAHRAAGLTRDLLAFSRMETVRSQPILLQGLVERIAAMLSRTLGERYEIEYAAEANLPPARADVGQIERVVINLALNARDAMPGGGRLTLEAGRQAAGPDEANVPPGDWLVITVRDEGSGMDESTRAHIFEPFFTTKPGVGSGLGLATAYGIVSQSGGHLTVESQVGQGSTFRIYLPVAEEQAPAGAVAGSLPARGGQERVLLVEDREEVRHALATGLGAKGLYVESYESAEQVLALTDQHVASFDALVSDVVMPGKSGVDLAHAIRARVPLLPVVLMSGELQGNQRESFPDGVRFLSKPLTPDALVQELRSCFTKRNRTT